MSTESGDVQTREKSTSHKVLILAKNIWLYPLRKNFAAALCQWALLVHRMFTSSMSAGGLLSQHRPLHGKADLAACGVELLSKYAIPFCLDRPFEYWYIKGQQSEF